MRGGLILSKENNARNLEINSRANGDRTDPIGQITRQYSDWLAKVHTNIPIFISPTSFLTSSDNSKLSQWVIDETDCYFTIPFDEASN